MDAIRSAAEDISRSERLKKSSEILIVDNHSKDETLKSLQSYKNSSSVPIEIIKNSENVGFARANNQAIKSSKGKYILLLNSDAYVQPHALEKLVMAFEETKDLSTATLSSYSGKIDRLGILSATLVNTDGTYQSQGGSYPTLFSLANHLLFLNTIPIIGSLLPSTQQKETYQYRDEGTLIKKDWVSGAAMMVRRDMINEIGTLDEKIFMYAEDCEFCVRAKDHHWDVALHPRAFVTHIGSASSSSARAIEGELRGYLYIWSKHKPIWQYFFAKGIILLGVVMRIVLFGTMKKEDKTQMYKTVWKQLS